jgi:argininosuccinate lyase
MPAYTHLQRAEPVLVGIGCWLMSKCFFAMQTGWLTAGGASILSSGFQGGGRATFPLDRSAMTADLDFAASTANSIDATGDRDFVLEFVNALSLLALHEPWAEEMIYFPRRSLAVNARGLFSPERRIFRRRIQIF